MARLVDLGGAPVNRSEAEIIQRLVALLPAPWVVIPNASLPDRSGHSYEYDAIAVGPHAVYVIEVKGWSGTTSQLSFGEWQLSHGRIERNPLPVADQKARVLKSLLQTAELGGRRAPYVQACLVSGSDDSAFDVPGPDMRRCLRPSQLVPYLLDPSQLGAGAGSDDYRALIKNLVAAVTGEVRARMSGPRRYGSFYAENLQTRDEESATWLGRHAVFPDGRVYRIRTWYLSAYRYNADRRAQRVHVLRRSAEALHRIGDHSNIATLRDFGEQAGEFYEVTDWSESGTLETAVVRGLLSRLPLQRRLALLRDMAAGLEAAFRQGVLHRGLAPDSIIVTPDGRARIIDFDRAFFEDAGATVYGEVPQRHSTYRPPELRDPKDYEVFDSSDLFSLSHVATDCLGADLPHKVLAVLQRAASDDPQLRQADPIAFLTDLDKALLGDQAAPMASPATDSQQLAFRPGDVIDGVNRVVSELGRGAGAVVYRVDNEALGETLALKVVIDPPPGYDAAAEFRWLRSASSAHLPRAHWLGRVALPDGRPGPNYLLLDYIDGLSLREIIVKGRSSVEESLAWTDDVLEALEALHPVDAGPGALHRDVKPENVVVSTRGAVLVDFGTAASADAAGAAPLGTLRYMPPDLAGAGWTPSADLFGVGCILFELLSQSHPWGASAPSGDRTARVLGDFRSDLGPSLLTFVDRAIAPVAASRFTSAAEMRAALRTVRDSVTRPKPRTTTAPPGEAIDQGARDLWNASRVQALVRHPDLLVPLVGALSQCVLSPADDSAEAYESAFLGSEARALSLEAPLPDAMPCTYDLLVQGAFPVRFEAPADQAIPPTPCIAARNDVLLVLDGLHFCEWPYIRAAAAAVNRTIDVHAWAAGPIDPDGSSDARELDAAISRVLVDAAPPASVTPEAIGALLGAGARAFRIRLPSGERTRVGLGSLLLNRRRLIEDLILSLASKVPGLWVTATFGAIYLGHGLRFDVGEQLGDGADDARARWAAAFPRGRVGKVQPGRLPSRVRLPLREAQGRRFPVGRLAWPDAPATPWLQSGGLSLPERMLPLFHLEH